MLGGLVSTRPCFISLPYCSKFCRHFVLDLYFQQIFERRIVGVGVVVVAAVEFKLLLRVDEDRVAQDQQPQLEPGVNVIKLFSFVVTD